MQRIVVLGVTGSGKTTFGRKLGDLLGIPSTDLDDLHWLPGWKKQEPQVFYDLADRATSLPEWVIIGNYSKVRQAVWPKADTFIWLDYPFLLVFWRLLRRSVMRAIDRNPVCNGNIESWKQFFSKDSILLWLLTSFRRRRREYAEIFGTAGQYPSVTYIRLRSPKAAQRFLDNIAATKDKTK